MDNKDNSKISLENQREKGQQNIIKMQNECYLCGKSLNTHIEYLPRTRFIVERAQCHNCMTVVRVKNHSLQ